jgi:hypothetical protein
MVIEKIFPHDASDFVFKLLAFLQLSYLLCRQQDGERVDGMPHRPCWRWRVVFPLHLVDELPLSLEHIVMLFLCWACCVVGPADFFSFFEWLVIELCIDVGRKLISRIYQDNIDLIHCNFFVLMRFFFGPSQRRRPPCHLVHLKSSLLQAVCPLQQVTMVPPFYRPDQYRRNAHM